MLSRFRRNKVKGNSVGVAIVKSMPDDIAKVTIPQKEYEDLIELRDFLIETENGLFFKLCNEDGLKIHPLNDMEKATMWASLNQTEKIFVKYKDSVKDESYLKDIKRCKAMTDPLVDFINFDEVLRI